MAILLSELDDTESHALGDILDSGISAMGMKYADRNGKFTCEDFLKAMKENEDMNKVFLKISYDV